MSSRKRPLAEISQPHSTPARYAPSTPHALRAIQQRNSAKKRSARSVRHVNNNVDPGNTVRPDGSARNILRQFAKITAPLTKKRISTPIQANNNDKENDNPQELEDEDSVLLKRPMFSVEESIDEDDSELPTAPTPSVLPDDDEDDQPTVTFQNLAKIPLSERTDRRKSRTPFAGSIERALQDGEESVHEGDATMMTERGRRAVSEEATGRLSRYSFGSFRMSDFGSELEFRRQSGQLPKTPKTASKAFTDYNGDYLIESGAQDNIRSLQSSPVEVFGEESVHIPGLGDDSFHLPMPDDEDEPVTQTAHSEGRHGAEKSLEPGLSISSPTHAILDPAENVEKLPGTPTETTSRRRTLLETATAMAQTTRSKRVKLNRHGNLVPSLPTSLVKYVTTESQTKLGRRKPKLGRDHVKALEQATEWYFEQVGEDLGAYSSHSGRKRVDSDDVLLLMRRQKLLLEDGELRKFAKEWLPRDVFKELDLPERL